MYCLRKVHRNVRSWPGVGGDPAGHPHTCSGDLFPAPLSSARPASPPQQIFSVTPHRPRSWLIFEILFPWAFYKSDVQGPAQTATQAGGAAALRRPAGRGCSPPRSAGAEAAFGSGRAVWLLSFSPRADSCEPLTPGHGQRPALTGRPRPRCAVARAAPGGPGLPLWSRWGPGPASRGAQGGVARSQVGSAEPPARAGRAASATSPRRHEDGGRRFSAPPRLGRTGPGVRRSVAGPGAHPPGVALNPVGLLRESSECGRAGSAWGHVAPPWGPEPPRAGDAEVAFPAPRDTAHRARPTPGAPSGAERARLLSDHEASCTSRASGRVDHVTATRCRPREAVHGWVFLTGQLLGVPLANRSRGGTWRSPGSGSSRGRCRSALLRGRRCAVRLTSPTPGSLGRATAVLRGRQAVDVPRFCPLPRRQGCR